VTREEWDAVMAKERARATDQRSGAVELLTGSVEETQRWGEALGGLLAAGDVLALHGELGSGKTTLIQGIARGLGLHADAVKSPTFVIEREYSGTIPLIHIDGYRLSGPAAAAWLDEDLLFSPRKVTVIEWADRFDGLLPDDHLELQLEHVSTHRRRIVLSATGVASARALAAFSTTRLKLQAHTPQVETPAAPPTEASDAAVGD
jgi:tRNA threonylcarbamoyladenosine biosynthesis protein TsaE